MAAVSESVVRECFEQRGFLVRQTRKYVGPNPRESEEFDFLVLNPQPKASSGPLPFVLAAEDLAGLSRAVVVVKAWHTEIFSSNRIEEEPDILRFVQPAIFRQATSFFGAGAEVKKILVVSDLPQEEAARQRSIDTLRARGVDGVLAFRALLVDLVASTELNRNYQKSDLFQTIRLLKSYDLIKDPQMELFNTRSRVRARRRPKAPGPSGDEASPAV